MSSTPNFDELKEDCNSNRLQDCFRYLFTREAAENDDFIRLIDDECDAVRSRMQYRRLLLQEGTAFSPFDPVYADGEQCMREAQNKDGEILHALIVVLDLAREAREERISHLGKIEKNN